MTEGLTAKLLKMLEDTTVVHDEGEREAFVRLSPREQVVVTTLIKAGEASTVEEAIRDYTERREAHERALERRAAFRPIRNPDAEYEGGPAVLLTEFGNLCRTARSLVSALRSHPKDKRLGRVGQVATVLPSKRHLQWLGRIDTSEDHHALCLLPRLQARLRLGEVVLKRVGLSCAGRALNYLGPVEIQLGTLGPVVAGCDVGPRVSWTELQLLKRNREPFAAAVQLLRTASTWGTQVAYRTIM